MAKKKAVKKETMLRKGSPPAPPEVGTVVPVRFEEPCNQPGCKEMCKWVSGEIYLCQRHGKFTRKTPKK
jgi:hypothetical protein